MYHKVRSGDQDAAKKMAESYIRLGMSRVAAYARTSNRTDDMVSAMLYGIVQGVHRIAAGAIEHHTDDIPNVGGYLAQTMDGYIRHCLQQDFLLSVNKTTFKRHGKGHSRGVGLAYVVARPTRDVELREVVESCFKDQRDPAIVRMKESGFTDQEIAAELGCSKQNVNRLRLELAERVRSKLNGYANC